MRDLGNRRGVGRRPTVMRSRFVVLLAALAVASCSDDTTIDAGDDPTTTERADEQRYETVTTVLESEAHGPQLCLGGVAESYPPQCGGPDIDGWDWSEVEGEESESGTTWGEYHVVGTYLDGVFTLTEPATPPTEEQLPRGPFDEERDFTSPCEPPQGGWTVVDPATATEAAQQAAGEYARSQSEFAGSWVDQSINPALADGFDPGDEAVANDPTKLVLNFRFTADIESHETALREIWGGALCVTQAERTYDELQAIQDALMDVDGFLSSAPDEINGYVNLQVILDDGIQQQLDERFGEGAVRVTSALRPVD